MTTTNLTKEEGLAQEIARFLVIKKVPKISADELESIFRALDYGEKELKDFLSYIRTPEGKEFFKKAIRLKLVIAGYQPKGGTHE